MFFFAADAFTSWQPLTSDAALQSALERVNLAHRVAADPVAVASAFHHHVEMFLAKVLDVSRTPSIDGVASRLGAGIFGPIAAFYGVTEPQLRGSLHVHLLLRLYAFTTPAAFLASVQQSLPDLCEALLSWTASVLATSLESLPRILRVPTVASTFSHLQPLPFPRRHRDVLGQQLGTSWDFDVAASHWSLASTSPSPASDPWFDPFHDAAAGRPSFLPWPREYLLDATSSPDQWALHLLYDLRHSAAASCLHDCRPKTCHKGTLGRLGFCRLGYWHWRDVSAWTSPETWQRCHGFPLFPSDTIGSIPPLEGLFLTARHHPFHTRFNYAVLAMAKCNHDVNVLVQTPGSYEDADRAHFAEVMAASTRTASFYITAYMSKLQPQIANLWQLLATARAKLETDLATQQENIDGLLSPQYIAKRSLTRMLMACQRRTHKSLPEICHY